MIASLVVTSSFTATGKITNLDRCFAIDAQAFNSIAVTLLFFGLDVAENCVCFWDFFLGLALTTGFNR